MPPAKISKSGLPSRRGPDFAPRETPDGSASGAMLPGPKQVTKQVLPLPEYAPQPLTGQERTKRSRRRLAPKWASQKQCGATCAHDKCTVESFVKEQLHKDIADDDGMPELTGSSDSDDDDI